MNKLGVFSFSFDNPDAGDNQIWGFIFSNKVDAILNGKDIATADWFTDALNELESSYGVHDWGTSPTDDVISVGYCTYEVDFSKTQELMEKWRQVFIAQIGESNVSELVQLNKEDISPESFEDETAIYNTIKSQLKIPVDWS